MFDLGGEAARVIDRAIDLEPVTFADDKVIVTMTGRGMYATCAGLAGDEFVTRITDIEFGFSISLATKRHMFADHQQRWPIEPGMTALEPVQFRAGKACQHLEWLTAFGLSLCQSALCGHGFQQFAGYDIDLIAIRERCILEIRMDCDAQVSRQRPGCGGPDQHENFSPGQGGIDQRRITGQRKLYVHRGTGVLSVFDLGFGQRRLIVDAPVDGARAFVDIATLNEAAELSRGLGFVVVGHRQVRISPLSQNTKSLKVIRLALESICCVFTTGAAKTDGGHVRFLCSQLFVDKALDRQTVAVIAGHVRRVKAHHRARADDEVFEILFMAVPRWISALA